MYYCYYYYLLFNADVFECAVFLFVITAILVSNGTNIISNDHWKGALLTAVEKQRIIMVDAVDCCFPSPTIN